MASETKERNALAELADCLAWHEGAEYAGVPKMQLLYAIRKARRIISELAKVEYVVDLDGNRIYLPHQASQAISKAARIIAEEGSNHGER